MLLLLIHDVWAASPIDLDTDVMKGMALLQQADRLRSKFKEGSISVHVTIKKNGRIHEEAGFELSIKPDNKMHILITEGKQKDRKIVAVGEKIWIIVPSSKHPLAVSPNQRLLGGISIMEAARLNFADNYVARLSDEEEIINDQLCLVLQLTVATTGLTFSSGTLWIDKKDLLPRKAVLNFSSGKAAKEIHFLNYELEHGQLVLRTMLIKELLTKKAKFETVLEYTNYRAVEIPEELFQP